MTRFNDWIKAYPLDIFPEPDFKKAHKVLKEHGMTLDAISASNMRHVLNGLKEEFGAMQAVCEAAEGFLNDVAVWGFRDEIVVNLKAALEAYLKLKT